MRKPMIGNFVEGMAPPTNRTETERECVGRFAARVPLNFINNVVPVHAQDITDNAVMSFKNHCVMTRFVDRQYDPLWGQAGAKRGTTINLRYPPVYELRRGNRAMPQSSNETFFPVTLGEPTGVDLDFTSQELLLTVDDFVNRFVKKAALPIANGVDTDLTGLYDAVPNFTGTPGSPPTTSEQYLTATEVLANSGAPVEGDEWSMIIDYKSNRKIVPALAGQYNPQGTISRQWEAGRMFDGLGYKWSATQNIRLHTIGTLGGTPLVDGANQFGPNILCDGAGGAVTNYLRRGDIVAFAGVYGVKSNSVPLGGAGESTGELKTFVVTNNVDSAAGGTNAFTIPISPQMILTGPTQNVTGSPDNNAAVTVFGHASAYAGLVTRQNLAFNKGAFVLGMVDLPIPGGMDMSARTTDEDTKISIRFLRGFDITENEFISRLDCLYVVAAPRAEFACRVVG